jgi:hypothetical protein
MTVLKNALSFALLVSVTGGSAPAVETGPRRPASVRISS